MLIDLYEKLVLKRPLVSLLTTCAVVLILSLQASKFKLDASADSLVLENDQALRYHRQTVNTYGANDYLVLTYTPDQDLFSAPVLADLKEISTEITALDGVDSVVSILNVPLLFSPRVSISELSGNIRTLESPGVNYQLAKNEFQNNPLYSKQLLSPDGKTTALLINLPKDQELQRLLLERTNLRAKKHDNNLTEEEQAELQAVSERYRARATRLTEKQRGDVERIRAIIDGHRSGAQMFLGGVPMIVADMISFIRGDIVIFGFGVLAFLIITMSIIFRKLRWIILPMICCFAAAFAMVGFLGIMDWRVTVISSNFISLMLIITMSLTIHLIVCYQELAANLPEASQQFLVRETVRLKFRPCLYTTLTTIVAFVSLLVSSIRPVMDFGLMMTMGLICSFVLSFLLFPAGAMLLKREKIKAVNNRLSPPFTLRFASFTNNYGKTIIYLSLFITVLSVAGISKLVVENRFIDYFRQSTEIHQGMKIIDQKLGGTTPLDVIIDLPTEEYKAAKQNDSAADLLDDDLLLDLGEEDLLAGGPEDYSSDKYWFTALKMERLNQVHDFLETLPETGKVQSVATMVKIATSLNDNLSLDDYELSLLYDKLPDSLKEILVRPYVSFKNNQVRFTMRVMESDKNLSRQKLLNKIQTYLTETMGFSAESIHFTNMVVLYNNMLQSLFRSQIMTIGVVFLSIMLMFMILFRSLSIAFIAIIPNLLPAAMVLGAMGWLGIPLDMMTITIAAISIGIAVDDTIHYIHRFKEEFNKDRDYTATMFRCHGSIGKAMYYTSITIIIGFSILVFSNFIPTIYFGIFTGFAMLSALLAAMTLLPRLMIILKPLGPEQ